MKKEHDYFLTSPLPCLLHEAVAHVADIHGIISSISSIISDKVVSKTFSDVHF